MKRAALLALLLLAAPARAADKEITLYPGEQTVLEIAALQRLAVGNPAVVEASSLGDGREVLLVGRQTGRTNVILWNVEGRRQTIYVNVVPAHLSKSAAAIRDLLKDVAGVEVKVVGELLTVKGEVASPTDYERVEKAARMYGATLLVAPPSAETDPKEIAKRRLEELERKQAAEDPRAEGAPAPQRRKLPPAHLPKNRPPERDPE